MGFVVLLVGVGNLARIAAALWFAARLPDLPMTVSWAYLAAMGALWGPALVTCAVGLSSFRTGWRRATLAVVTLQQAHVWANHLLFDANDAARRLWPRDLVLTLLLLLYTWGVLSLLPGVRKEFTP